MAWGLVAAMVAAAVVVAGAAAPVLGGWRPEATRGARARARSAHARLGHLLETTPASTSWDRAQERWTTSGGVLSRARTARQYALAEQVAREGQELLAPT